MIRLAINNDIKDLCHLRIIQQKEDRGSKYENNDSALHEAVESFLLKHLNKDFIMFLNIIDDKIVSISGLQIIVYLPNTNNLLGL